MASISDLIEEFLIQTLGGADTLNINRNELAAYFAVAPSQINYVLTTRFTPRRGYLIESKRGGGGYITLLRINKSADELADELLSNDFNEGISYQSASDVLLRLTEAQIITENEAQLIRAALADKALLAPAVIKDKLRAAILKNIFRQILKSQS